MGITKQGVGQLVDDLERFGLVARLRDPSDGRAKRVCFTKLGRQSMLDGLRHLRGLENELRRELGRETMSALHDALLALHEHLEA